MSSARRSRIHVIAGVNGAGKSSIQGAVIRQNRSDYFNPDEAARQLMAANSALTIEEANSIAWWQGVRLLKRAIDERLNFTFETTLGGNTMTALLREAAQQGIEVHVWYAGLANPELHIKRVQARVSRGGHDIHEADIRRRYQQSQLNLIELLPHVTTLHLYDNSRDADPAAGKTPELQLVLQMKQGKVCGPDDLTGTPDWAKAIVAAALKSRRP